MHSEQTTNKQTARVRLINKRIRMQRATKDDDNKNRANNNTLVITAVTAERGSVGERNKKRETSL